MYNTTAAADEWVSCASRRFHRHYITYMACLQQHFHDRVGCRKGGEIYILYSRNTYNNNSDDFSILCYGLLHIAARGKTNEPSKERSSNPHRICIEYTPNIIHSPLLYR